MTRENRESVIRALQGTSVASLLLKYALENFELCCVQKRKSVLRTTSMRMDNVIHFAPSSPLIGLGYTFAYLLTSLSSHSVEESVLDHFYLRTLLHIRHSPQRISFVKHREVCLDAAVLRGKPAQPLLTY